MILTKLTTMGLLFAFLLTSVTSRGEQPAIELNKLSDCDGLVYSSDDA